nr:transposase domain-containing protein [Listeria monocytogenes]
MSSFSLEGKKKSSHYKPRTALAERHIRPLTIGRKNFMFSTRVAGAKANCVAYTLIETAKANSLNAFKYLTHLFEELPNPDFLASQNYWRIIFRGLIAFN